MEWIFTSAGGPIKDNSTGKNTKPLTSPIPTKAITEKKKYLKTEIEQTFKKGERCKRNIISEILFC